MTINIVKMTVAHPGADYCALCMVQGVLTPAMPEWPGAPCCRACIIACGGTVEETPGGPAPNLQLH